MNIVLVVLISLVLLVLLLVIVKNITATLSYKAEKMLHFQIIIGCVISIIVVIFSTMVYLGKTDELIKQGVFRKSVIVINKSDYDIIAPLLTRTTLTDVEEYDKEVRELHR